jgi:hypothetical protein
MELTRSFSPEQFSRGLESWAWIDIGGKVPLFTSPFGDVFFRSNDGFWWLDTVEGRLSQPWRDAEALRADLNSVDGQDQYLLAGLALGAEQRGIVPTDDQVYGFTVAPTLGGSMEVENIEAIDFVVSLHIAGQIHEQIRDWPPGTPISGVTIQAPS